jgi:hypothetical protein
MNPSVTQAGTIKVEETLHPQSRTWWDVLRRYVSGTSLWVWANAAAWAVGMPVVFLGAGASPAGSSALSVASTVIITIAAAGASVSAIHGAALLWLLRRTTAQFRADRPDDHWRQSGGLRGRGGGVFLTEVDRLLQGPDKL